MKIEPNKPVDRETSGNVQSKSFGINAANAGLIMKMFSDSVYSDKYGSIVREIVSNGVDATVEAGSNEPVIVSIKEEFGDRYLQVQDFGVGISEDRMNNIYKDYFSSSKRESDDQIGGWGIGAKVPLAYTDTFDLITNYAGTKYHYIVSRGTTLPEVHLMSTVPTDDPNGTTVKIPIASAIDQIRFERAMHKQLAYFKGIIFDNCGNDNTNDYKLYEGETFIFKPGVENYLHLSMGGVYYSLDNIKIPVPIAIKLKPGEFKPTLSRETIEWNDEVAVRMAEKIVAVVQELAGIALKEVSAADNYKQYLKLQSSTKDLPINFGDGNIIFIKPLIEWYDGFRASKLSDDPTKEEIKENKKKYPKINFENKLVLKGYEEVTVPRELFVEYRVTKTILGKKIKSPVVETSRRINRDYWREGFTKTSPQLQLRLNGLMESKLNLYISNSLNHYTSTYIYEYEPSNDYWALCKWADLIEYNEKALDSYQLGPHTKEQQDHNWGIIRKLRQLASETLYEDSMDYEEVISEDDLLLWYEDFKRERRGDVLNAKERLELGYLHAKALQVNGYDYGFSVDEVNLAKIQHYTGLIIYGFNEDSDRMIDAYKVLRSVINFTKENSRRGMDIGHHVDKRRARILKIAKNKEALLKRAFPNAINVHKFMKDHKVFKKVAAALFVDTIQFPQYLFEAVNTDIHGRIQMLRQWRKYMRHDTYIYASLREDILNIAFEQNLFSEEVIDNIQIVNDYFKGLDLLFLISGINKDNIHAIVKYIHLSGKPVNPEWYDSEEIELRPNQEGQVKVLTTPREIFKDRGEGFAEGYYDQGRQAEVKYQTRTQKGWEEAFTEGIITPAERSALWIDRGYGNRSKKEVEDQSGKDYYKASIAAVAGEFIELKRKATEGSECSRVPEVGQTEEGSEIAA